MFTIFYIRANRIDIMRCHNIIELKINYQKLINDNAEIICIKNSLGEIINIDLT